jgi:hypothetical protein
VNKSVNLEDVDVDGRIRLKCILGGHTQKKVVSRNLFHETVAVIPNIEQTKLRASIFKEETLTA